MRGVDRHSLSGQENRFQEALAEEMRLIEALAQRLQPGQFFSHRSAALLWGIPLPHLERPELHLSTVRPVRAPRVQGVTGHAFAAGRCRVVRCSALPVTDPACTWAALGHLPVPQLVAAGDFLVRKFRVGAGRPQPGRQPLARVPDLREALARGRWSGMSRLQEALTLIREDSWSPRESTTRVALVWAGLPEPELNVDVRDAAGRFLACLDMAYTRFRVAVEYQGELHGGSYAADIERVERLRAAGWIVIQVSRVLASQPHELVRRVRSALLSRGWEPVSGNASRSAASSVE